MLKTYEYQGLTYQFEEGRQPAGAVEVPAKAAKAEAKEAKPANKAQAPKTK